MEAREKLAHQLLIQYKLTADRKAILSPYMHWKKQNSQTEQSKSVSNESNTVRRHVASGCLKPNTEDILSQQVSDPCQISPSQRFFTETQRFSPVQEIHSNPWNIIHEITKFHPFAESFSFQLLFITDPLSVDDFQSPSLFIVFLPLQPAHA